MGSYADERLFEKAITKQAGKSFRFATEQEIATLADRALVISVTEKMPLEHAIRIETGQARLPYGSRKNAF